MSLQWKLNLSFNKTNDLMVLMIPCFSCTNPELRVQHTFSQKSSPHLSNNGFYCNWNWAILERSWFNSCTLDSAAIEGYWDDLDWNWLLMQPWAATQLPAWSPVVSGQILKVACVIAWIPFASSSQVKVMIHSTTLHLSHEVGVINRAHVLGECICICLWIFTYICLAYYLTPSSHG